MGMKLFALFFGFLLIISFGFVVADDSGLVSWWKFDESAGPAIVALDFVGGNTISSFGGGTISSEGKVNNAFQVVSPARR